MDNLEILDPLFRDAVTAVDHGDVSALERLLTAHPRLVRERVDCGEGYFRHPYLLGFVAENPVRNGTLPTGYLGWSTTGRPRPACWGSHKDHFVFVDFPRAVARKIFALQGA